MATLTISLTASQVTRISEAMVGTGILDIPAVADDVETYVKEGLRTLVLDYEALVRASIAAQEAEEFNL